MVHPAASLSSESFGFTWPGKAEAALLATEPPTGRFTGADGAAAAIDPEAHVLIEGENSEALRLLQQDFAGRIRAIYIDPPYNTGNASFAYADNFRQRRNGAKNEPSDKHAAWLSMMHTRLLLARRLLREDGVLFVSIDDHEVAHLRLLLDEVFGEEHFVGQAIWVNRTTPNDAGANFATDHEYVLIYARNKANCRFKGIAKDLSNYQNRDGDPQGPWIADNPSAASGTDSYRFPIVNPHTGQQYLPPKGRYWAFAPARVPEWTLSGKLRFPTEPGKNFVLRKYQSELRSERKPMSSVITGYLTASGTKELKALFDGESPFRFPKPVALIRHLIEQATEADDWVLDFFAGSGTTAQAVLELNADQGTSRRFICIQRPEPNSSKDAALREKYPLVSDVTKARVQKAWDKCYTLTGRKPLPYNILRLEMP